MPKKTYAPTSASTDTLQQAAIAWLSAKEAERAAVETRRSIEDYLATETLRLAEDLDSSLTFDAAGYEMKVTGRLNRKVDGEAVNRIAVEAGLVDQASSLFRWKAELSLGEWKKADPSITSLFAPAIVTTPGRPSFDIVKKEEKP